MLGKFSSVKCNHDDIGFSLCENASARLQPGTWLNFYVEIQKHHLSSFKTVEFCETLLKCSPLLQDKQHDKWTKECENRNLIKMTIAAALIWRRIASNASQAASSKLFWTENQTPVGSLNQCVFLVKFRWSFDAQTVLFWFNFNSNFFPFFKRNRDFWKVCKKGSSILNQDGLQDDRFTCSSSTDCEHKCSMPAKRLWWCG